MTQNQFWNEIQARTSKEIADYGMQTVNENDLPGTSFDAESNAVNCNSLDEATAAVRHAYEAFNTQPDYSSTQSSDLSLDVDDRDIKRMDEDTVRKYFLALTSDDGETIEEMREALKQYRRDGGSIYELLKP